MDIRQVYKAVLIELNKQEAPSLLLDEFNYIYRKASLQYLNYTYGAFDVNQQKTDDMRVLSTTAILPLVINSNFNWECLLPINYVHILNCVINYTTWIPTTCEIDDSLSVGALRLTSDMYPNIINNYYFKPTYKRPYYYISDSINDRNNALLDLDADPELEIKTENGNPLYMEIRMGRNPRFQPVSVTIDYIKYPKLIELSADDLDDEEILVPILEFPEYVCYEIINLMVRLCLEKHMDVRLQSNPAVNQSIIHPFVTNNVK